MSTRRMKHSLFILLAVGSGNHVAAFSTTSLKGESAAACPSVFLATRSCSERQASLPRRQRRMLSMNLSSNNNNGGEVVVERPDPSILLSSKSDFEQRLGVTAIGASLLLGTYALSSILVWLQMISGGLTSTIIDFTVPVPLGLLFVLLGGTHFFYKNEYAAIVPPKGAWGGLWNVPTPGAEKLGLSDEEYHVLWSGAAEMGGGALLVLGGLHAIPVQIPAFLMFVLTLAVTPANIYMFTHDVPLAFSPPLRYPDDHIVRGVIQIILLSLFWYLASHP